jgi:hypothetical protein
MARWIPLALAGAVLAAPALGGCGARSAERDSPSSGARSAGEATAVDANLLTEGFVRGGGAGLAKARSLGRGAMLLFVATW